MKTISRNGLGPWLVVNTEGRLEGSISKYSAPTRIQPSLAVAFAEAARLAAKYPGSTFGVFECLGILIEEPPKKEVASLKKKCKTSPVRSVVAVETKLLEK